MFRFTIRDVLWLMVVEGMGVRFREYAQLQFDSPIDSGDPRW